MLAIGDKVRVKLDIGSTYSGQIGTILSLDSGGPLYSISVLIEGYGPMGFDEEELEHVRAAEPAQEATSGRWSVGDRVRIETQGQTPMDGREGTVVRTFDPGYRVHPTWTVKVDVDGVGDAYFAPEELRAAPVQTNKELWV